MIDTHTHLDHLDNLSTAMANASQAGVDSIVTVGVDLASNKKNLEIKKKYTQPKIYVALGIHPGNIIADELDNTLRFIEDNIQEAVAVGETGLDYWYKWVKKDEEKKQEQWDVFQLQLELGKKHNLPVIIHSRGAWKDCFELTKKAQVKKALFHWYSGPVDVLDDIIKAGYYVSTTPSLAYSPQSREAISQAPIKQTLIETDTPVHYKDGETKYMAEPKDVFRTLKAYSELKDIDQDEALKIFNQNAKDFFGL